MDPYTEMNDPETLEKVLKSLERRIERFYNIGNERLAKAFSRRKLKVFQRLEKVQKGEINGRRRRAVQVRASQGRTNNRKSKTSP